MECVNQNMIVPLTRTTTVQWSDRVTKPLWSFSNIETFLDFLNVLDIERSFIRVRAILERDLHAQTSQ